jgi:hypothetical protein
MSARQYLLAYALAHCGARGVQLYPFLRRRGIRFTPLKKITAGFVTGKH